MSRPAPAEAELFCVEVEGSVRAPAAQGGPLHRQRQAYYVYALWAEAARMAARQLFVRRAADGGGQLAAGYRVRSCRAIAAGR